VAEAVIVGAVRTPTGRGRPGGRLAAVHPVDLLAGTLRELVRRTGVDPSTVDDVIAGCVSQVAEQSRNIARNAVLAAGFPQTVPATTVDRMCGSSQQAVHFAAQGVQAGAYDIVIACGVESMSRVPMRTAELGADPYGPAVAARYPAGLVRQGISAELIAARWKLSRSELDEFAAASHHRAAAATAGGGFAAEIVPVPLPAGGAADADEGIRPDTSVSRLAQLPAAFAGDRSARRFAEIAWRVTAGNTSQLSDGAAALLITSADTARRLGLRPRARFRAFSVVGDDPVLMLTGVIPATHRVLHRAGLRLADIDLVEINEAFASVVLAWQAETGADLSRVNVRGGAIALGHPLGASGARLMTTLLHALEDRGDRLGLQVMCEAGGMANATVLERC
jgi:acetyl-CoA acyltransferase